MPRLVRLSTCSALALGVAAGPAFAELTAQEVWDGMEAGLQNYGYSVTATETTTSEGLLLSDVLLEFAIPEDNSTVEIAVGSIDLDETGDGSVSMTFPASMPITIDAAPEDEDAVNMVLDYANTDLEIFVSGAPSALTYTYSADALSIALAELIVNGETIDRDAARFEFIINAMTGTATIITEGATRIAQDLRAESIGYDIAFNDPESSDTALISGSAQALTLDSTTTLPEGFDPSNPESLMASRFLASGKMGYEEGEMQFAVTEPAGTTNGTTQSGSAAFEFELNDSLLRYDVSASDQSLRLTGPELPVPVDVSMAQSAFKFTAPITEADTPQDMVFGLTLGGFEMSDLLWNMVDPAAALPRDPATIALDLTGQVTPFVNLLDPAAMAGIEDSGEAPGELNSLTLNALTIEAAGAKLGGTGSFTFDNQDLETFAGFPRPSGELDLTIDGANTLIDKLIAMGLLTNEDAMGARMMMGMFAVPGDGPDNLKSSIQINDQGHVLANGMRIQ
ncbi:DUF2125 domain-containing protein [Marivita sp. S0852]|uniref:DUF2125 domain-containing protein n=1 Tax=Marivita sp. S0852 TaxID=3373893 RepID=UPI003982AB77